MKNGHIDHITFEVADIDLSYEALVAEGMQPVETSPIWLQLWTNECKYFTIIDPNGERIELNQILI